MDRKEKGNREVSLCKLGPSGAGLAFMVRNKKPRNLLFEPSLLSRTPMGNLTEFDRH